MGIAPRCAIGEWMFDVWVSPLSYFPLLWCMLNTIISFCRRCDAFGRPWNHSLARSRVRIKQHSLPPGYWCGTFVLVLCGQYFLVSLCHCACCYLHITLDKLIQGTGENERIAILILSWYTLILDNVLAKLLCELTSANLLLLESLPTAPGRR